MFVQIYTQGVTYHFAGPEPKIHGFGFEFEEYSADGHDIFVSFADWEKANAFVLANTDGEMNAQELYAMQEEERQKTREREKILREQGWFDE